MEAKNVEF